MSLRLLAVALALAPAVVIAQEPAPAPAPSPSPTGNAADAELEAAKVHFQQAVALYNDGNFSAALAEFNEAYRLHKTTGVLYNIGLTQKSLFRYSEAIESLQKYLAESQNLPPERRQEVEQLINEMRALLADVTVDATPPGATIAVDGRVVGQAPLPKPLGIAAGSHTIEVTADGYKPQKKDVLVTAQVPVHLSVALAVIPKTGKVHITASVPQSLVSIDGKSIGYAPVDAELQGGGHQLQVVAPKYQTFYSELVIAAGQTRTVDAQLMRVHMTHFYEKWYFWTPIAVVAAGLAVGLGVGLTYGQASPINGTLTPGVGGVN